MTSRHTSFSVAAAATRLVACLVACSGPSHDEAIRRTSAAYDDPAMWLCRPDLATDACRVDLTTTELLPDGSRTVRAHAPAHDAPLDCFYIYPTVDLSLVPGNHVDFSDVSSMRRVVTAQIARFSEVCNVYAPLYRQVTIGTYLIAESRQRQFADVAYSDIAAAFHTYLQQFDHGRPIVIVGHSQGAQLATRLLRDTFDRNEALRSRLVVAMPIGFLVDVPDGATTGGSFEHLTACRDPDELGCFVTFMTAHEGDEPTRMPGPVPQGHHAPCVDPALGPVLTESVFPAQSRASKLHITTPYVSFRDFYRARCVEHPDGRSYLEVAEARGSGDVRPSPIDLDAGNLGMGLHIYDFQLPQGDLIELVRRKLAAWQRRAASTGN
jgi:hypothetical protein